MKLNPLKSLIPLILLSACGFQPMYGAKATADPSAAAAHFSDIYVDNIPDRSGQVLRNELIDRLYRNGRPSNPAYTLKITELKERVRDLDLTRQSENTRSQIRIRSTMSLIETASGKTVLSRNVYATSSYNELISQFATRVTEADARTAVLNDLARQIEQNLALYFNR